MGVVLYVLVVGILVLIALGMAMLYDGAKDQRIFPLEHFGDYFNCPTCERIRLTREREEVTSPHRGDT